MKALLICPSERAGVASLSVAAPLAAVPALGQSLLEYWLAHAANSGVKEVVVLAHDRPELITAVAGNGERWGLVVRVAEESRELSPAQAQLKYAPELGKEAEKCLVATLDRFPEAAGDVFSGYEEWYHGLRQWLGKAATPDRVGMHEVRPGIWQGAHSHVSEHARLHPPCWMGQRVYVGAGAELGPGSIIEDGVFIEPNAEVAESWVAPDTFVGQFARISGSLALGSTLIDWRGGTVACVPDSFLLCSLRKPRQSGRPGWLARLADLYEKNKEEAYDLCKHLLLNRES